jgi:RecA-family ATPase
LDWTNPPTDTAKPIIPDIIGAGQIASLVGQGAVGKSLLIFEVAMALAAGRSVLGHPSAEPLTVLYVDMENPVGEVYQRRRDLGYEDDALDRLAYYHMPNLPALDTSAGGKLIDALAARHSAELVILDTISKLVQGEESKADTWQDLYRYTMTPMRRNNRAVLILDHQGHDATRGARGSSAKRDNVDIQWIQTRRDDLITLRRDKARSVHEVEELKIRRAGTPVRHTAEHNPEDHCISVLDRLGADISIGREKARDLLSSNGYGFSVSVINAALRTRKNAVQHAPVQNVA